MLPRGAKRDPYPPVEVLRDNGGHALRTSYGKGKGRATQMEFEESSDPFDGMAGFEGANE